jgi:hypothetical protein
MLMKGNERKERENLQIRILHSQSASSTGTSIDEHKFFPTDRIRGQIQLEGFLVESLATGDGPQANGRSLLEAQ